MPFYRYRLYTADGAGAGEAEYAVLVDVGDKITTGDGRRLLVRDLVPIDDGTSDYIALLEVEPV